MPRVTIPLEPLTRDTFAPFGDVIQVAQSDHRTINQGWAERYLDLAKLDTTSDGGKPSLGIVRAEPRPMPLRIRIMERHPMASQAFVPLVPRAFVVVVARPGEAPGPNDLRAFRTTAGQGVNYARGVWHHPLIAIDQTTDFLVIDREGSGDNCDEFAYDSDDIWVE